MLKNDGKVGRIFNLPPIFLSLARRYSNAKLVIMAAKLNQKSDDSFEASIKELEDILVQLENPQIPLSDLVSKYERAKECLNLCRKKLDDAELVIKKLSKDSSEDFALE